MPIKTQTEFEYRVDERDWSAVKLLVEELEQELAQRRSHLLFRIAAWSFALKLFKRVETEKIVLRSPDERDRRYHKALLAFLRGSGEVLLVELHAHQEVDPKHVGVSFADLAALVEELKISERERYGDMKDARRAEILKTATIPTRPATSESSPRSVCRCTATLLPRSKNPYLAAHFKLSTVPPAGLPSESLK